MAYFFGWPLGIDISAYLHGLLPVACVSLCVKVLGRILKVGVQIFKQGVQGSNVHDLFNPAGPRRSPFFPARPPPQSNFMQSMLSC